MLGIGRLESVSPPYVAHALPGKPIVADVVDDVRMVKSEFEIARLPTPANG
jgi:hypothetical protein